MSERVYGIDLEPVPEGVTPLEAFVVLKALDENGELVLYRRASAGLSPWEIVGMLTGMLDGARDDVQAGYVWDEPDEVEDD